MKIKEGGFEFRENPTGWTVYHGGRKLGTLVTMREVNDRYCFRLGEDEREYPRTYRGRVRAANALKTIEELLAQAKKERWSRQQLILRAWDAKPATAPQSKR